MSKLRDLVLLLPDFELEGYPRSLASSQAANLLGGWISLWHPALIGSTQAIPRWNHAGHLPTELADSVFVLPEISREHLVDGGRTSIADAGGYLHESEHAWRELQTKLIDHVPEKRESSLADELVEQFAALGYAYLQIQLMTRQLRYTSNLDQLLFSEQVCKAVDAAFDNNHERAEQMLQACFDSLGQERDHYYSLDVNLLDLTLLAPSTLGKSLAAQLSHDTPTTYLATAELFEQLKAKKPENFDAMAQALSGKRATHAGGLPTERPHPLMPRESAVRDIQRGKLACERLGIAPPRVFARLSYGLHAHSASMLKRFGFDGVLLTAITNGAYPEGSQVKMSWESPDGTFLPALAAPVIDAADPAYFLSLGWRVGELLDHQHVPTVMFAHWPNADCDFYALLKLIAKRTPAFGKWRLIDEYFVETDQPYHQERLTPATFRMNWLNDSDSPQNLLERTQRLHELQARGRGIQNLLNLSCQLAHFRTAASAVITMGDETTFAKVTAMPMDAWAGELKTLNEHIDSLLDKDVDFQAVAEQANDLCERLRQDVVERLRKQLSRTPKTGATSGGGRLILNATACPIRAQVHTEPTEGFDTTQDHIFASGRVGNDRVTCIDVPSMGFVVAPLSATSKSEATKNAPIAASGGLLQNEFLETQIDAARGHLKSLHVPARRGNRLSVMLAHRERNDNGFTYSEMVADDVRMLTSSNMCGVIRATGQLENNGATLGKFEIDYEVWRGSRILEVNVRLSELKPSSETNPWKSAYIMRIAWPNEAAIVRSFSSGGNVAWASGRAVSPELIEIDETDYKTHILTGGLAFHRRTESRFLEILLASGSQKSISKRVGVAVELPSPLLSARRFLDRRYELAITEPVTAASGWMVSVDVLTVSVDLETPLVNESGAVVGVRLFVSENAGKTTNVRIRLLREVAAAHRVDYLGGRMSKLTAKDDQVTIALRANEQVNIDVLWHVAAEAS